MKSTYLKLTTTLACVLVLTATSGCAVRSIPGAERLLAFIPGSDRIFHKNSTAEVGPVLTASGERVEAAEPESAIQTVPEQLPDNAASKKVTVANPPKATETKPPIPKSISKPQISSQAAPAISPKPAADYEIKGKVSLLTANGAIPPYGVIARLHRLDGQPLSAQVSSQQHVMDMIGKSYAPGQMIVNKGDTINFLNKDKIRHNVFSSTGANAFDLGTFGGGLQRGVTLNKDGIVKVYCNIHPRMAAFVAVDELGVSQIVRVDNGTFQFENLPAGDYRLTLWNVRGEQTRVISLQDKKQLSLNLTLDTTNFKPEQRVNKFGEAYKKKSLRREYY
ncbi:MAG: hypothetical protein MI976_02160 [Pseudomonadales bacterium]|nr:hypothetical protein [Pseudomonadales bacterium]